MGYLGTPIDTNNTFQSLQGKRFSGNGSTTAFTLDIAPASTLDIEVFVENVRQDPNSAYSLSGTTLTFSAAPDAGTNNIYVVHQAKAVATISAGAGTVNAASMDNTVISGHDALAATPAGTDELLISDAGTIKRIDASFFQNTPAFRARLSSNQSIPNSTQTKMALATEDWDTDSAFDSSTNYRFTVPSGKAGKYVFTASITAENIDDNEFFSFNLYLNGSAEQLTGQAKQFSPGSNQTLRFTSIAYISLSVGDYIEAYVSHNEGGAINLRSAESSFGGFKLIGV